MFLCDAQCQEDLIHYAVIYWVLVLPLWLSGLLLLLGLVLVGLSYRRWPILVGGCILGVAAALTTYALWVAASSSWTLVSHKFRSREPSTGFMNRLL